MTKEDRLLPLAALEKLLKNAGAERVSKSACLVLKKYLEEEAVKIGKRSITYALHAGRKTIKGKDIELVLKDQ